MYKAGINLRLACLEIVTAISICLAMMIIPVPAAARTEHPHLPPRPVPTYPAPHEEHGRDEQVAGARIELQPVPYRAYLWTGVQWQDGMGRWHDVIGWQGTYNRPERVSWFVEEKDFGKGPYRWLAYAEKDGALLGVSQEFRLPTEVGQIVKRTLELP